MQVLRREALRAWQLTKLAAEDDARALRAIHARDQSKSIEQRFIALLDAGEEQPPYRIRQMVQLLGSGEGIRIYWPELLRDLLAWNHERRPVQQKWARAFYRTVAKEMEEGEEE